MDTPNRVEQSFWGVFWRHNLPVLLFLLAATAGMITTYVFFNPTGTIRTQAIATVGDGLSLSVPISKPVASRVVRQRFAQTAAPMRLAIIVGHRNNDSGAVCDDGLTELAVNTTIAEKVLVQLEAREIYPLLFDEFDPRLDDFEGTALISLHADSCGDFGPQATGFKIAGSSRTDSSRLKSCLDDNYMTATGMGIHENTITSHMTDYHAFRKIAPGTPAVIVETGFMNRDRQLLTTNSDIPASGIANGILCFLEQQ